MKQYPFPKNKWFHAAFFVFLFAMLLVARDTLITSLCLGFYRSQFLMLAMIAVLGLAFVVYNRHSLRQILTDGRMCLIFAFALLLLAVMVLKRDWQMMYFSILLCPLFAVFLTYFTDSRQVSRYFVVILTALSVYSVVVTYYFRRFVFGGIWNPRVLVNSAGMGFFDFGLCFLAENPYWNRNFGIFREPGVYQFFLILGLYLNNYVTDWKKPWQTWLLNAVLTFTMITTFSVGGFIELAVFAVFLFFDKGYHRSKPGKVLLICVGVLAAATAAFLLSGKARIPRGDTIWYEFYDMLVRLTTDSESLLDRLSAIFTDVEFFLKHPVLGAKIAPVLHGTNHNTSSTLILYAILGIFGGTVNVAAWIALLWKKKRNWFGNLVLLGVLFMSFNTQNLVADVFFWLFPTMALVERGLPVLLKRKKEEG